MTRRRLPRRIAARSVRRCRSDRRASAGGSRVGGRAGLSRPSLRVGEVRLDRLLLLAAERRVRWRTTSTPFGLRSDLSDRLGVRFRGRCRLSIPWRTRGFIINSPSRYGSGFFSMPRRLACSSRRCWTSSRSARCVPTPRPGTPGATAGSSTISPKPRVHLLDDEADHRTGV